MRVPTSLIAVAAALALCASACGAKSSPTTPTGAAPRVTGLTPAQIGEHAGAADTSLALAVDPALVKSDRLPADSHGGALPGVTGDPHAASAALGQLGVDAIVAQTVAAIRRATQRAPR